MELVYNHDQQETMYLKIAEHEVLINGIIILLSNVQILNLNEYKFCIKESAFPLETVKCNRL